MKFATFTAAALCATIALPLSAQDRSDWPSSACAVPDVSDTAAGGCPCQL